MIKTLCLGDELEDDLGGLLRDLPVLVHDLVKALEFLFSTFQGHFRRVLHKRISLLNLIGLENGAQIVALFMRQLSGLNRKITSV